MDPINFGDQKSKVKVTIDVYGNKLVNMKETKPLCTSSSNLADILAIVSPSVCASRLILVNTIATKLLFTS